jgi:hypothetical protein
MLAGVVERKRIPEVHALKSVRRELAAAAV